MHGVAKCWQWDAIVATGWGEKTGNCSLITVQLLTEQCLLPCNAKLVILYCILSGLLKICTKCTVHLIPNLLTNVWASFHMHCRLLPRALTLT
jgi:hypothetical protein